MFQVSKVLAVLGLRIGGFCLLKPSTVKGGRQDDSWHFSIFWALGLGAGGY